MQASSLRRSCSRPARPFQHCADPWNRRGARLSAVASRSPTVPLTSFEQLQQSLAAKGAPEPLLRPKRFITDGAERIGFVATRDIDEGEVLLEVGGSLAVTAVDAAKHEVVGAVAAECEELVALAVWLLAERAKGEQSVWRDYLATLPARTESPLLWSDAEVEALLRGSQVGAEAGARRQLLQQQWQQLEAAFSQDAARFAPEVYNWEAFQAAFSVVLAHCTYLPTAECLALLPLAGHLRRTPNDNGCDFDYDVSRQAVTMVTTRPYREGQEVAVNEERPNGELLLARGELLDDSPKDCLLLPAALLPADRYYQMKVAVLEQLALRPQEVFPVFADRMPLQLLAYVRLARLQDPALFAKVSFQEDVVLSQMNEYEVLQLLMGDCRERLAAYASNAEDEIKLLQRPEVTPRERLAARLRLSEKLILGRTMDGLRRKLAPIRGIPTKGGGMQDPNADLREIFETIEDLPNAPKKIWNALFGPGEQQQR